MAITNKDKATIVEQYGQNGTDTGSAPVQIALLTFRIIELTDHCKQHPKDNSTRRGLLQLVCQRRKFLNYLAAKDQPKYKEMLERLSLRR